MRKQRNTFQTKDKNLRKEKKNLNEMETSNSPDKKFKGDGHKGAQHTEEKNRWTSVQKQKIQKVPNSGCRAEEYSNCTEKNTKGFNS